jgi:lipopolysaccharide export system permease protein
LQKIKILRENLKTFILKKVVQIKDFQITFAKKGIFELKGNKRILVLYDGQTLNNNGDNITNFNFSKSDFGLSNMDSHLVKVSKDLKNCKQLL